MVIQLREMDSSDDEFFISQSVYNHFFGKERSYDAHPVNKERKKYGEFHHLYPELRKYPDKFYEYTRMSIGTFDYILDKVESRLTKNWSNFIKSPILPPEKLIVTLRYLATGASFTSLGFSFRMGRTTVGAIVKETCIALWEELQPVHMLQPNEDSFKNIAEEFWRLWNFPNCVGALDGKHIRIKCPTQSGSMYYNYKKFFSIVLQGVADAHCKFIAIEVGGYGKQSDGGTFSSSHLFQLMKTQNLNLPPDASLPGTNILMPYVFLGDEAYPLLQNLIRPYARRDCNVDNEYFNTRLSRARKCIECAFGIINAKWRLLWKPIETDPSLADIIVKCICVLHNIIIDREGNNKVLKEAEKFEQTYKKRKNSRNFNHVSLKTGRFIRDTFRDFVCRNR